MQIKDLNINALFNLTSAAVVVFGYLWASLANNKRMDDVKNLLLAEIRASGAETRSLISDVRADIKVLSNRMDLVEKRLDRIEGQLEHPIVHPG